MNCLAAPEENTVSGTLEERFWVAEKQGAVSPSIVKPQGYSVN
jgi:hypothetical protein